MPNSSVFSSPSYRAKLPKTTFPMTQEIDFSSVAGTLTPVFMDFLHPGEKVSGSAEMFTRTNELQTAAFAKIDEYIEYFFVPAMKLNQVFGEWFFNIDDRPTALRPSVLPERANVLPNITYDRLYTYLDNIKSYRSSDSLSSSELTKSESLIRMMQHFRYDVYHLFDVDGKEDLIVSNVWNFSLVPFQVYQAVYYDYYRDSIWQNNDVEAYNTDDWMTSLTAENISDERLSKIFQMHQRRQNSDYYTGSHPSPLQNATGMLNIDGVREQALLQLNQWLENSGVSFAFGHGSLSVSNTNVTIQNSIPTDGVGNLSISGNGGIIGDVSEPAVRIDSAQPSGNWLNTQEHNVLTDAGAVNSSPRSLLVGSEGDTTFAELYGALQNETVISRSGSISGLSVSSLSQALGSLKSSISSVGIRTMFALEKLAKVTGRAGKHYDDQVYAHYGVKVSSAYSNEVMMIGQQHSTIEIGEVVSPTTVPDGSVAGEIVGKGYGSMKVDKGAKVVDFTAPCHGYFLAVYSAVPRRVYTPTGNPREFSQLYRFDFMQPELMNLGQQPLFGTEVSLTQSWEFPVLSWNWRYMEEKCRVPMAIGALSRFSNTDQTQNGALSDWTIQYPLLNDMAWFRTGLSWTDLLVAPTAFNSIMLLQYDYSHQVLGAPGVTNSCEGKVARLFDRDPLFHRLVMKIYKSSYMSTYGEPSID